MSIFPITCHYNLTLVNAMNDSLMKMQGLYTSSVNVAQSFRCIMITSMHTILHGGLRFERVTIVNHMFTFSCQEAILHGPSKARGKIPNAFVESTTIDDGTFHKSSTCLSSLYCNFARVRDETPCSSLTKPRKLSFPSVCLIQS